MPLAEQAGLRTHGRRLHARQQGRGADALRALGRGPGRRRSGRRGARGVRRDAAAAASRAPCCSAAAAHEAELDLREARRHLRTSSAAQFALPLAGVEAEFARSGGDLDGARATSSSARWPATDIGEEQRYKWPVLSLAARIEAERAIAARDAGRPDDGCGATAAPAAQRGRAMAATTPADRGHLALVARRARASACARRGRRPGRTRWPRAGR